MTLFLLRHAGFSSAWQASFDLDLPWLLIIFLLFASEVRNTWT